MSGVGSVVRAVAPAGRSGGDAASRRPCKRIAAAVGIVLVVQPLVACTLIFSVEKSPFLHTICVAMRIATGEPQSHADRACSQGDFRVRQRWIELPLANLGVGATSFGTITMEGFQVKGTVPGSKLPEWSRAAYPDLATRRASRSAANHDIVVAVLVLDDDLNPAADAFATAKATVYSVDRKGKKKKLASKTGAATQDEGGAVIPFSRLKTPASHYLVEVQTAKGKVVNASVLFMALVTQAGATDGLRGVVGGLRRARALASQFVD